MVLYDVILGTGNYENVKSGNTVSITGDGGNAWGYYGPAYKKLAPRLVTYEPYAAGYEELKKFLEEHPDRLEEYWTKRKELEDEYIKSYYEKRLKGADAGDLLEILHERFGAGIILLCHEPIDEFCHRRLVADWITIKTGFEVPEVSVDSKKHVKRLVPIDYTDRLKQLMK